MNPGDLLGIGNFLGAVVDEVWYSDEEKAANQTAQEQARAKEAAASAQVDIARIQAESRQQTGRTLLLVAGGAGLMFLAYTLLKDE